MPELNAPRRRPARTGSANLGPVDASLVPRFAGFPTFGRLPTLEEVGSADVAIVGVPFDAGTSYRPGARFGPASVRSASRLMRPYHQDLDAEPFEDQQVADAGDVPCTPFDIECAIAEIERSADGVYEAAHRIAAVGGDHTIALPMLRAAVRRFGSVALVHFDAHLDTWDTYFGTRYTHGSPFRRAAEERLLVQDHSVHIGTRGPLYDRRDLTDDATLGFEIIGASMLDRIGVEEVVEGIRDRVASEAIYVSVDIDVLDPAHAPGTGTPEAGGLSTREMFSILRGLQALPIVGIDIVEVAPPYDHAEITSVAASNVLFELLTLMGIGPAIAERAS